MTTFFREEVPISSGLGEGQVVLPNALFAPPEDFLSIFLECLQQGRAPLQGPLEGANVQVGFRPVPSKLLEAIDESLGHGVGESDSPLFLQHRAKRQEVKVRFTFWKSTRPGSSGSPPGSGWGSDSRPLFFRPPFGAGGVG